MAGLPATGGNYNSVIAPSNNPLDVRYGQITAVLIRDYLDSSGNVQNLANPNAGVGTQGLFTPFAADGLTIRNDLLWNAGGTNQGWFNMGLLKEDSISVDSSFSVQETNTAQTLRTVRNVFTKLDDKIMFTTLENSDLVKRLRFNLTLSGWTPDDGTLGYQLPRGAQDVMVERQLILFLIDTDNQLVAEVFPRVAVDKIGKVEFGRKMPYSPEGFTFSVLPDPYSQQASWLCEAGSAWVQEAEFGFISTPPTVTPATGLKATVTFPTPTDIVTPTYTAQIQTTATGAFASATVASSPAPSVSGAYTTLTVTGLTSSTSYNALKVTATAATGGRAVTSASSAPFTATSA
jgi:hypothetical protein